MHSTTVWILALLLTLGAAACGGGSEPPAGEQASAPAAEAPAAVDEATAGSLAGKVTFDGQPPRPDTIRMNADPVCVKVNQGQPQQTQYFVVSGDGSLKNVFVYVKEGLGNRRFEAPSEPIVLDQRGCRYEPHVFGVQVGQPVEILNSDPTLHNIHAMPARNQEFNTGQPIQGMKFTQTFRSPEVMVPFKCDVHGWMNAYVGVLEHPYFAVTGEDGSFTIDTLPPGDYVVEAWHEKMGAQTQNITVGEKETKEVNFTFKMTS